jgi:predicted nucleotidyltransferase
MANIKKDVALTNIRIKPTGCDDSVAQSLPIATERIARELQPEKIILFGSYAYGKPSADSDVDLLVIMETDKRRSARSWQVARLLIPRSFPVDILVRTPAQIADAFQKGIFYRRNSRQRQNPL